MRRRTFFDSSLYGYENYLIATFNGNGSTSTNILGSSFDINQIKAIYVDDKKVNTKSTYTFGDTSSHTVVYEVDGSFQDMTSMFESCTKLTTIDSTNLNDTDITGMSRCFYNCYNLKTINLPTCTLKFTDASYLFYNCYNLTSLTLSTTYKPYLTNTSFMYYNCKLLPSIKISYFRFTKTTDMSAMFMLCENITSLTFTSIHKTSLNTSFHSFFYGCKKLSTITGLSYIVTPNVQYMGNMFYNTKFSSLDLSHFDTSKVIDMSSMFELCYSLSTLTIPFNTSNVTEMNHMFQRCPFQSLDLSSFDTSKVTDMTSMFNECSSLISLNISNFNTTNVTYMGNMFRACSSLETIKVNEYFNVSKVTDMYGMFTFCQYLESFGMKGQLNTSLDTEYMFSSDSLVNGVFYYDSNYDYTPIINVLPSTWTAVAV